VKIRSITLGTTLDAGVAPTIEQAGQALAAAANRFTSAGYDVQTTRLCLPPLSRLDLAACDVSGLVAELDAGAAANGIGYVALGPVRWRDGPELAAGLASSLAAALADRERAFGSIETADQAGVRFEAVQAAAGVVRALAESTEQGFGNLRFAALAKCPPHIPFFPAAYHEGAEPVFGLALQAADLAMRAFEDIESLAQAEHRLSTAVQAELQGLEQIASALEDELGLRYAGADPTLAPFPDEAESVGAALERLGVGRFGAAGTLAAAALVTRSLQAVNARRCGFAGLMLPVLEDPILARRAAEGLYSWEELLLFSSVCGTGLDTLPLAGDVSVDELAAMILDVSTLAVALDKPLTCRLLPVPGKAAGELTTFDFAYFANGGVLRAKGLGSPTLLQRGLASELQRRSGS
jgi:uncharacterized protein (UPF0210 family)